MDKWTERWKQERTDGRTDGRIDGLNPMLIICLDDHIFGDRLTGMIDQQTETETGISTPPA